MVPLRVVEWLRRTYPKPTVNPDWLDACLTWISEELQLTDINAQADEIISHVDLQLLNSDLRDSMLPGTGFPDGIHTAESASLTGNVLVQIQAITDIGHSALSLQNVQQTRRDRQDLAGVAGSDDEDEGPIPQYPRGMLRFDLTDGSNSLRAIEYRRMPELELGMTPLGFKMVLKDVPIRGGIAFLEPSNVILKGHMTEELDVNREADFAKGLRMRLGQPEPESDDLNDPPGNHHPPPPPHADLGVDLPPDANNLRRTPLREMTARELEPRHSPPEPARQELEPPTRRRVPAASASTSTPAPHSIVSPYFTNTTSTSATLDATADLRLSPVHRVPLPSGRPIDIDEDSLKFSDDMPIDDAFLQELEAVEQAAMNTAQQGDQPNGRALHETQGTATTGQADVIVIDSDDDDDKENLAPVSQRRVRRRIAIEDESEVIVIE